MPLIQEQILWQMLELYKLWEVMAKEKYTDGYGATKAIEL